MMTHVSTKRQTSPSRASAPTSRRSLLGPTGFGVATSTIPPVATARLAYDKWQRRGCPLGDDLRDWFDAEAELIALKSKPPSSACGR